MDEMFFQKDEFLLNLFNTVPAAMLVVDDDVRIFYGNSAALKLSGTGPGKIFRIRGGEVLHCIHATDTAEGCGRGPSCKQCVVRSSVRLALEGNQVYRKTATMELMHDGSATEVHLLVTAAPLQFRGEIYALVILEDVSELIQLRSLLPICSVCKKIRNDKEYWEGLESYFSKRLDVNFSHSLCPDCAMKQYPGLKEDIKKRYKTGAHTGRKTRKKT